MSDNALRVDDDTAEMRKIKAFADIRVIRDLEMILAAQSVESPVVYVELDLGKFSSETVIFLDLIVIVAGTAHYADVAEFGG
jgi:hypothetical protein